MNRKPIIALVGSAAVGKSTLLPMLARKLELPHYAEDAEANPILTEWYLDRPRWNYWVQLFFHSRRVVSQFLAEKSGGVMERTLFEDLIFHELAMAEVASDAERERLLKYKREIDAVLASHRAPDYIFYLTATWETQQQRFAVRARDSEDKIASSFMLALNAKYEEFFGRHGRYRPTATIVTDSLSLAQVEAEILRRVRQ